MSDDILNSLPHRRGHFLLESGYHTDLWFTLDSLFSSPREIAPLVTSLGTRLAAYSPSSVCGPLLGGAFLAQAIATQMGIDFYYTELATGRKSSDLYNVTYRLPERVEERMRDQRVAVVDDVISAGSSVRATVAALENAGASVVVLGSFALLGSKAEEYFSSKAIAIETLERREFQLWPPTDCPHCQANVPLEDPTEND